MKTYRIDASKLTLGEWQQVEKIVGRSFMRISASLDAGDASALELAALQLIAQQRAGNTNCTIDELLGLSFEDFAANLTEPVDASPKS